MRLCCSSFSLWGFNSIWEHVPVHVQAVPRLQSSWGCHSFQFASELHISTSSSFHPGLTSWSLFLPWNTLSPWFPGHYTLQIFLTSFIIPSQSWFVLNLLNLLTGWHLRVLSFCTFFFLVYAYLLGNLIRLMALSAYMLKTSKFFSLLPWITGTYFLLPLIVVSP